MAFIIIIWFQWTFSKLFATQYLQPFYFNAINRISRKFPCPKEIFGSIFDCFLFDYHFIFFFLSISDFPCSLQPGTSSKTMDPNSSIFNSPSYNELKKLVKSLRPKYNWAPLDKDPQSIVCSVVYATICWVSHALSFIFFCFLFLIDFFLEYPAH